jgi:hypothetical protein
MSFLKRFKNLIRYSRPDRVVPVTCTPCTTETKTSNLEGLKLVELREVARKRGLKGYTKLRKADLFKLLSE